MTAEKIHNEIENMRQDLVSKFGADTVVISVKVNNVNYRTYSGDYFSLISELEIAKASLVNLILKKDTSCG